MVYLQTSPRYKKNLARQRNLRLFRDWDIWPNRLLKLSSTRRLNNTALTQEKMLGMKGWL
ncbi:Hypothetical protein P9303_24501 [Prochlorococcus marinus str. MIT 9303]|uniref:Uncharacterized protein n=1 Tax=Prochlorococcus marinus (strain MIT 9303) TaxID=59922 RepID=A2CCH1_PROM3|nr:Hypothetical protein P9303_24501 [Prochlorococcus marinus str. MIT 9303]